jgi:hypothetical protein
VPVAGGVVQRSGAAYVAQVHILPTPQQRE